MGTILPKWKKQKSSKETLEAIETSIQSLIQNRSKTQQCERSLIGTIIVTFFLLYPLIVLVGVVLWVWFTHLLSMELSVVFILLIALLPIMFYGFRKLISTYFNHRQTQYDLALQVLHSEKKKVLDEVMEKEPYKIARELLEKYEPSHSSLQPFANKGQQQQQGTPNVRQRVTVQSPPPPSTPAPPTPHPALRHRFHQATPLSTPRVPPPTPVAQSSNGSDHQSTVKEKASVQQPSLQTNETAFVPPGHCLGPSPGPPFPVPILPRERSNLDRVVEYILGDGPSNRYALICCKCHSHNGMALKEDFEYLAFRCAYCYEWNPARKVKPQPVTSNHNTTTVRRPSTEGGTVISSELQDTPEVTEVVEKGDENNDKTENNQEDTEQ